MTEVDRATLPSYQIGLEDGEARGKAAQARKIAISLMDIIHDDEVIADKTGGRAFGSATFPGLTVKQD